MPAYANFGPSKPPVKLLTLQEPVYLIGQFGVTSPNANGYDQAIGRAWITADAAVLDTSITFTVVMKEGNIPSVGDFISTQGPTNSSGQFVVTYQPITAVSINASTGIGTITIASASATAQSTTADGGTLWILPQEVGETISAAYNSIPVTIPMNDPKTDMARTVTLVLSLLTSSSLAITGIYLQGALRDENAEYTNIGSTTLTLPSAGASASEVFTLEGYRFFRLALSGVTGSGSIVAKIQA